MKKHLPLIIILFIAAFLRFYDLGVIPPGVNWDEASLGYNAYSIAETGKDEHGVSFPISNFAAFGDYKPPLYIYTAVPMIKLFGLSPWTTRFPSALAGVLTVLLTYYLAKELFSKRDLEEEFNIGRLRFNIPLLSSLALAVSPWHIQISRAAFESNLATFFIVLGIYLFLKAINSRPLFFIPSLISFVLSLYTFNSPRLFVPIFLSLATLIFIKEILKNWKWFAAAIIISGLVFLPLAPHLLSKEGGLRFQEVTIFTDLDVVKTANLRINADNNDLIAKIIHNRRVGHLLNFAHHYFDHFNPNFLFINGDLNPKFSVRDIGELYLTDLPLIIAGFYFLIKNRDKKKLFLFVWFLTASIPSATARETPHALRSLLILPTYQLIISYGLIKLVSALKGSKITIFKKQLPGIKILLGGLVFVFIMQFLYFQHNYYSHYKTEFSVDWQYGYKEMVPYVDGIKDKYDEIWVSSEYGRPYIFFLFYKSAAPSVFWQSSNVEVDNFGFYHVNSYDKYNFGQPPPGVSGKKILYVGAPSDLPKGVEPFKEFKFLNGETAFVLWE